VGERNLPHSPFSKLEFLMSEKDKETKIVISEDDGTDPLTLTNFILAHDARKSGFNWTHYGVHPDKTEEELFADAAEDAFVEDEYTLDEAKKKKKVKKVKKSKKKKKAQKPAEKETSPVAPQQEPTPEKQLTQPRVETNTEDPNVFSTNPEMNMCPAFIDGICRVDGRPCPFDNTDYRDCGKYRLASSGKPELFEIPPGREAAPEYLLGIKS
jgi:hypothetical protein